MQSKTIYDHDWSTGSDVYCMYSCDHCLLIIMIIAILYNIWSWFGLLDHMFIACNRDHCILISIIVPKNRLLPLDHYDFLMSDIPRCWYMFNYIWYHMLIIWSISIDHMIFVPPPQSLLSVWYCDRTQLSEYVCGLSQISSGYNGRHS